MTTLTCQLCKSPMVWVYDPMEANILMLGCNGKDCVQSIENVKHVQEYARRQTLGRLLRP